MGPVLVREMGCGKRERGTGRMEVTVWGNEATNEDSFCPGFDHNPDPHYCVLHLSDLLTCPVALLVSLIRLFEVSFFL